MNTLIVSEPGVQKPLPGWQIFCFCLANIGFGMFYAFNNSTLGLWLQTYTLNPTVLGFVGGTHSFEGAIIQPLVGAWSDKLRTPFGRRRPFLLAFVPAAALLLVLTPAFAGLPAGMRLAALIGSIFLSTVAFNMAADPYQALLSDITPTAQRGRVTGIWYFFGALGQVLILLAPVSLTAKFGITATTLLLLSLVTALTTREPPLPPVVAAARRETLGQIFARASHALSALRQARVYLLFFFFFGLGVDAVVPNLTLFVQNVTHCSPTTAQRMYLILMLTVAVGTVPFGWVSDKIGPHKLLLASGMILVAAAALGLTVQTLPQVGLALALAGLGVAAQNASAFPLLTRLVPREEIGFFVGLQTAAISIAGPIAVGLAGQLILRGGYRMIFAVCAVCIVIGLFVLTRLRVADAVGEIAARDLDQGRTPLDAGLPQSA